MVYIIIGGLGFLVIHIFDIVALKKVPGAKPVVWILGSGMLVYALVMLMLQPAKLSLPAWMPLTGWLLLSVSLILLIYSLFISLPFRKTYVASGVSDRLITKGMYSLVRHPGVIWLSLVLLSLILVSSSSLLLAAAPLFIFLDIILVTIQDKVFFSRMFDGYQDYRLETPMVLPNRKSFYAFINSLKRLDT
ncbi:MAG: methyltransferase [Dehalococcoidales bacterium]